MNDIDISVKRDEDYLRATTKKSDSEINDAMRRHCERKACNYLLDQDSSDDDARAFAYHAEQYIYAADKPRQWPTCEHTPLQTTDREPIAAKWSELCQAQSRRATSDAGNSNNTNGLRR